MIRLETNRVVDEDLRRKLEVTRTMVAKDADMKLAVDTAAYLAPEIKSGGEPTDKSDAYALGVAFFRLMTGLWYEPGPHAIDLLAPFNKKWRGLFEVLLASDPTKRSLPPLKLRTPRRFDRRIAVFLIAAVLIGLVGLVTVRFGAQVLSDRTEGAPEPVVEDDFFTIPASVK